MPRIKNRVLERVRERLGESTAEKMQEIAGSNEEVWEVWNTGYTNEDYERDLEYHEEQMEEYEEVFEAKAQTRRELLKEAAKESGLSRRRLEAKAKTLRKQAMRAAMNFMEHLNQYEEKMDDITSAEVERVRAGEGAVVQREEAAEGMREGMQERNRSKESTKMKEAEVMRDRLLDENKMGEGLEKEREAVRKYERNEIGEEELGMEDQLEELMESNSSETESTSSSPETLAEEPGYGEIDDDDIDDLIER